MVSSNFKPLDIPSDDFSFTNAFDGTSIPKPPPSPPPQANPQELKLNGGLSSHPTTPTGNGDVEMKDANAAAMPPPAKKQVPPPLSPDSAKRPSSVRKLLSLGSLREKPRDSHSLASPTAGKLSSSEWDSRPGSPYGAAPSVLSNGSARPSLAKKRSSGWFGSRRKSGFFGGGMDENAVPSGGAVQPVAPAKPKGPPPPTIPEFQEFGSINGALSNNMSAEDMFKDIK
jgi:hypothetical protein